MSVLSEASASRALPLGFWNLPQEQVPVTPPTPAKAPGAVCLLGSWEDSTCWLVAGGAWHVVCEEGLWKLMPGPQPVPACLFLSLMLLCILSLS